MTRNASRLFDVLLRCSSSFNYYINESKFLYVNIFSTLFLTCRHMANELIKHVLGTSATRVQIFFHSIHSFDSFKIFMYDAAEAFLVRVWCMFMESVLLFFIYTFFFLQFYEPIDYVYLDRCWHNVGIAAAFVWYLHEYSEWTLNDHWKKQSTQSYFTISIFLFLFLIFSMYYKYNSYIYYEY